MQTATLSGSNWGTMTHNFATAYSYDFNGNITSLQRNNETAQSLHNISYQYNNTDNRLQAITATGINSSCYNYDAIGNLTADTGDSLQITWNAAGVIACPPQEGTALSPSRKSKFVCSHIGLPFAVAGYYFLPVS